MPPATYFRQYMVAWKVRGDSEDINDEGKPINHTMPGNGQLAGLRLKKAYLPDTDSAADAARWRQLSRYLAIWQNQKQLAALKCCECCGHQNPTSDIPQISDARSTLTLLTRQRMETGER